MCPFCAAIAMKHRQKEIREAEAELERYKYETDTLQAKLIEAEKILVSALCMWLLRVMKCLLGTIKGLTCALVEQSWLYDTASAWHLRSSLL